MFRGLFDILKFIEVVRSEGIVSAVRMVRFALYERYFTRIDREFDQKHNINAGGVATLSTLNITSDSSRHGVDFIPMHVPIFPKFFSYLPEDLHDFIFIDFGSGKGRTLLLASLHNFKAIIGIEFSAELHCQAEANIISFQSPKQVCFDITSICMDAITFSIPDEKVVLYLYFPFKDCDMFSRIAHNIRRSYQSNPRKLFIVLYYPTRVKWLCEIFDRLEFLKKCEERPISKPSFISPLKMAVYESVEN